MDGAAMQLAMTLARRQAAALLSTTPRRSARLSPSQNRQFGSTSAARADFTHAVVGGGVVGLAIARQLSRRAQTTTLLLERHGGVGTETSSRNSSVVHAGLYYGADSLKARLCVRGRGLLYALCEARGVGHARVGKWIVAQTEAQRRELARIHALCRDELGVPTAWVAAADVAARGEGVRAAAGALESPETGIVDAHALVLCLLGLFEDAGGTVALRSAVERVEPLGSSPPGSAGWRLHVRDAATRRLSAVTAETLVNAAGLGAAAVHNMIAPPERRRALYFAKGTYFSYAPPAAPRPRLRISRLVYPAPEPGAAGLGTHLTLDLAGRIRFGPDVEWVARPDDLAASPARLARAAAEIRKYLPAVDDACLSPDYAGIRPKLSDRGAVVSGHGFNDFVIQREDGYEGWVNLLGIESPGLTSCLAIAETVERLLHGSVSG